MTHLAKITTDAVLYNILWFKYVLFKCKKPLLGVVALDAQLQTSLHSIPMLLVNCLILHAVGTTLLLLSLDSDVNLQSFIIQTIRFPSFSHKK